MPRPLALAVSLDRAADWHLSEGRRALAERLAHRAADLRALREVSA